MKRSVKQKTRRLAVLVVHGVGEQTRFEHLESIASNLYKALHCDPKRRPHMQVRYGDQVPRHSVEESWQPSPAIVRWRSPDGVEIEAHFREVRWADLDLPYGWWRWLKFVGWALGMPGVRLFSKSAVGTPQQHGMCRPKSLTWRERVKVRALLFAVSLTFFLLLITIDVLYGLLRRVSLRAYWLGRLRGIIYNYVGDVKLYQDYFKRWDERLDTIGEKSRVAIRRRMVRAVVDTAKAVEKGELDGYYIFAHSLGTVVAFNALMETDLALPAYLTEEEWNALPRPLKTQVAKTLPGDPMPARPPWLDTPAARAKPKAKVRRDAINRWRLFEGFCGFLTLGSPLDKFAALWPAIVPVNAESIKDPKPKTKPKTFPWINVSDVQDIVAGRIDLYPRCSPAPGIGGLALTNIEWADQVSPLSAHTSYWRAQKGKQRLIDRIAAWLEGRDFQRPPDNINRVLATVAYWFWLIILVILLLWLAGSMVWFLSQVDNMFSQLSEAQQLRNVFGGLGAILKQSNYLRDVLTLGWTILRVDVAVVFLFAFARWVFESAKFSEGTAPARRE